ncbi:MAG: transporter substrate-binding domain-containing protein [Erysipelotrichaceae bacterium]|nr:transporter substrate-binding domain-containing protein [Erysipelotrichaceae bacterium]
MKRTISISLVKLIAFLLIVSLFSGCSAGRNTSITDYRQLNSKDMKVGAWTGSISEGDVKRTLPEAQIVGFNDCLSGYAAVQKGEIDAFAYDRLQMEMAIRNGLEGVKVLDEDIGGTDICVAISPKTAIPDLKEKVNQYLKENRDILDDMYERWSIKSDYEMPDIEEANDPEYHLIVATSGRAEPYTYYKDGELWGYDIELAKRFALWINADLEFKTYNYDSIIDAALNGEVDCIMANLNVTPERQEVIEFSDPVCEFVTALMVRDQ